jgi:hypothetical protein
MKALTFTLCLMLAIISTGCFPTSSGSTTDGSTDGSTGGTGGDETCTPTTNEPTDADVEELIKTGDAVPGQGGANFTFFGPPIIDPNGRIAFWAGYENGEGDAGIFVWNGTEIVQILSDDPRPRASSRAATTPNTSAMSISPLPAANIPWFGERTGD